MLMVYHKFDSVLHPIDSFAHLAIESSVPYAAVLFAVGEVFAWMWRVENKLRGRVSSSSGLS
jgi:type III secretion system FlhB-like substrate exporter